MTAEEMADRVARAMRTKLGIRGRDLEAKLRRSRGLLPGHVQAEAALLADAARRSADPRLRMQADPSRTAQAYARCMAWLGTVDRRERRWFAFVDWLAGLAFRLLILSAGILALLLWRDLV